MIIEIKKIINNVKEENNYTYLFSLNVEKNK